MVLRPLLLGFLFILSVSLSAAPWVSTNLDGDVARFFFNEPARMESYDLETQEWLETVNLPQDKGPLTAGHADEDGIYIGFANTAFRYQTDGSGEVLLVESEVEINTFATTDTLIFVPTSRDEIADIQKSNNALIDVVTVSFFGGANQIDTMFFNEETRSLAVHVGRQIDYRPIDEANFFTQNEFSRRALEVRPDFRLSIPETVWLQPDGPRWFTDTGLAINESSARPQPDAIQYSDETVIDMIFRDGEVPISIIGNEIVTFQTNFTISAQTQLSQGGEKLYLNDNGVTAFGELTDALMPSTETFTFDEIASPRAGTPKSVVGIEIDPDAVFADNGNFFYFFSRSYGAIFRWDATSQSFVESFDATGTCSVAFSPSSNRIYHYLEDGRIVFNQLNGSNPSRRLRFATLGEEPIGNTFDEICPRLLAADDFLIVSRGDRTEVINRRGLSVFASLTTRFTRDTQETLLWDPVSKRILSGEFSSILSHPFRSVPSAHPNLQIGQIGRSESASLPFSFEIGSPRIVSFGATPTTLVLEGGAVFDISTNELSEANLGTSIEAGARVGNDFVSVREISNLLQIQRWRGNEYEQDIFKQVPGMPIDIIGNALSQFMLITTNAEGLVSYDLFDSELNIVVPAVLSSPEGLQATITGADSLVLDWLDISGEDGYRLERRETEDAEWVAVGTTSFGVTTFSDQNLSVDQDYFYRVIAVNGDSESLPSQQIRIRLEVPRQLTGFTVDSVTENTATLSWDRQSPGTTYQIEFRRTEDVNRNPSLPTTSDTPFALTRLSPDTEHTVRVRARNAVGTGPFTESLTFQTLIDPPGTPGSFRQTTTSSFEIGLSWFTRGGGNSVILERLDPDDVWQEIYRGSDRSFTDLDVVPETDYSYRIAGFNVRGVSEFTTPLEVSTEPISNASTVSSFSILNRMEGVQLRFRNRDPSVTSHLVERRSDSSQPWEVIATLPSEVEDYLDADTVIGRSYTYRIIARNFVGNSPPSPEQTQIAIDGICLVEDDFDTSERSAFAQASGGELILDGGSGFPESGVYWFGGFGNRSLTSEPLDLSLGGTFSFRYRFGASDDGSEPFWDMPEGNESISIQLITQQLPSEFGFQQPRISTVATVRPDGSDRFITFDVSLSPTEGLTRVRVIQDNHEGTGLDVWAIDEFCILGNRPENNPPVFSPTTLTSLQGSSLGETIRVNFAPFVNDDDLLDSVFYELGQVSNPALFDGFEIGLATGVLDLDFAAFAAGSSVVEVIATDRTGARATHEFTVTVPNFASPSITREGTINLNPLTGLFEQSLTIANNGSRTLAGVRLLITQLNADFTVFGVEGNVITSETPLAPGETLTVNLEYHSPTSGITPRPGFATEVLLPALAPDGTSAPATATLSTTADSARLLAFDAVIGNRYAIEYSNDTVTWIRSEAPLTAGSRTVFWLDQGLPKTNCHPSLCGRRFYRAIPLSEEE